MKYKLANGWTKQTIMERVKKYNNGKRAMGANYKHEQICLYETIDNNRCAIGCFIPDDHVALKATSSLRPLLDKHIDLKGLMPFTDIGTLEEFQFAHDGNENVHEAIQKFLDEKVK